MKKKAVVRDLLRVLKKMIEKLEGRVSFGVKSVRGRKSIALTPVEDKATAIQKGISKDC